MVQPNPTRKQSVCCSLFPPKLYFSLQLETVGMVPQSYFDDHKVIYAHVERVIDGDTIRVRHIPAYALRSSWLLRCCLLRPRVTTPLQQRGIANETLSIRIYGVDCPELGKGGGAGAPSKTQPYALEAKSYAQSFCLHQVVRITFLRKDQYQRAVAVVETLPRVAGVIGNWIPRLGRRDLSVELAKRGLAELYTGGGAEYWVRACVCECVSSPR
jgi:endonuclease YncB( thermonuclease family)